MRKPKLRQQSIVCAGLLTSGWKEQYSKRHNERTFFNANVNKYAIVTRNGGLRINTRPVKAGSIGWKGTSTYDMLVACGKRAILNAERN